MILGIQEDGGIAKEIVGIPTIECDDMILRLESAIRDGLQPRSAAHRIRAIAITEDRSCILLRMLKSWGGPHMVTSGGDGRFYLRNANGKHRMDVGELKSAFVQSADQLERLRDFRQRRLASIKFGETPVRIVKDAVQVLHIFPIEFMQSGKSVPFREHRDYLSGNLIPMGGSGWNPRFCFDGFVTCRGQHNAEMSGGYTLMFHNGAIEAVSDAGIGPFNGRKIFGSIAYEKYMIESLDSYKRVFQHLELSGPFAICVAFLNVKGYELGIDASRYHVGEFRPIDKGDLMMPEILVDGLLEDSGRLLRPAFDLVWNSFGAPGSYNYDASGNWKAHS